MYHNYCVINTVVEYIKRYVLLKIITANYKVLIKCINITNYKVFVYIINIISYFPTLFAFLLSYHSPSSTLCIHMFTYKCMCSAHIIVLFFSPEAVLSLLLFFSSCNLYTYFYYPFFPI